MAIRWLEYDARMKPTAAQTRILIDITPAIPRSIRTWVSGRIGGLKQDDWLDRDSITRLNSGGPPRRRPTMGRGQCGQGFDMLGSGEEKISKSDRLLGICYWRDWVRSPRELSTLSRRAKKNLKKLLEYWISSHLRTRIMLNFHSRPVAACFFQTRSNAAMRKAG